MATSIRQYDVRFERVNAIKFTGTYEIPIDRVLTLILKKLTSFKVEDTSSYDFMLTNKMSNDDHDYMVIEAVDTDHNFDDDIPRDKYGFIDMDGMPYTRMPIQSKLQIDLLEMERIMRTIGDDDLFDVTQI